MVIEVKKDPRYRIKKKFLTATAQKIIKELNLEKAGRIGIILVGKRKAKQLNQQYRKMDYIPEVLVFPYQDNPVKGESFFAEVVICFPLAREKAIKENQSLEKAITELIYHGLKHLAN